MHVGAIGLVKIGVKNCWSQPACSQLRSAPIITGGLVIYVCSVLSLAIGFAVGGMAKGQGISETRPGREFCLVPPAQGLLSIQDDYSPRNGGINPFGFSEPTSDFSKGTGRPLQAGAHNWHSGSPHQSRGGFVTSQYGGSPAPHSDGVPLPPNAGLPTPPGPVAEIRRLDDVEILAQVGSSWILARDIRLGVAEVLEEQMASISPRQLPVVERMATVRILDQMIETRLLYLAAKQRIPAERWAAIEKQLSAVFEKEELPRRIKQGKFSSLEEYKAKLERLGSSLEHERRLFTERAIASQWLLHAIGPIAEPDPAELFAYYRDHLHEFETPAQARWEEVWVTLPRYSSGEESWAKLAAVGNMLLHGLPLEEALARQASEPPRCEGTRRDWMPLDSPLIDPIVQQAVLHLPEGAWSEIFRSGNRLYIVRVLERKQPARIPFTEAQAQIRKRILEERRRQRIQSYLAELRAQTTVWTVFDGDPQVVAWRQMWSQSGR